MMVVRPLGTILGSRILRPTWTTISTRERAQVAIASNMMKSSGL